MSFYACFISSKNKNKKAHTDYISFGALSTNMPPSLYPLSADTEPPGAPVESFFVLFKPHMSPLLSAAGC